MSEIYVIRAILDAEEDVIRDVAIRADANLFDLHQLLIQAFDLDKGEMSSFFKSNEEWNQGEEISMMDFDPETGMNPLDSTKVSDVFAETGSRMLFVYDYLDLWTFYLETLDIRESENNKTYPHVIASLGERPKTAPHKEMKAESQEEEDPFSMDDDIEDIDESDDDNWY